MNKIIIFMLFLGLFVAPSYSFGSKQVIKGSVIIITTKVDLSITGYQDKNLVKAETNWDQGYWLIKNDNVFVVLAKI